MQVNGHLLTASVEDRTLTYRLLPFGEAGSTNLGKITASAGSVTVPDNVGSVGLNIEHDFTRPVGRATEIHEDKDGLVATFKVSRTTAGNDLLEEAAEGLRAAVSVEIDSPVIRDGALISGALTGAGAVVRPAFPSAQLVAADAGELDKDTVKTIEEILTEALDLIKAETPADEAETPEDEIAADAEDKDKPVTAITASAPQGLTASKGPQIKDAQGLFASLASAHASGNGQMLAALDNAIQADVISTQQPSWLGEIWSNRSHVQKYAPLLSQGTLTALKSIGWRFVEGKTPTVGEYAGFPAQPVSTEVKTESFEVAAKRIAGAGAIDRAFVDFSTPEFWSGYYRESADSYSRQLDALVLAHLLTPANVTTVVGGAIPVGVSKALAFIVDGVAAVQEIAVPTFAIVGADLYRDLLLTKSNDAVEYLNVALGLDPNDGSVNQFKIVSSTDAALAGKVFVGSREAAELKQLGGSPIRIDSVNISNGGVETGVFGYHAEVTKTAKAFALVGPTAP